MRISKGVNVNNKGQNVVKNANKKIKDLTRREGENLHETLCNEDNDSNIEELPIYSTHYCRKCTKCKKWNKHKVESIVMSKTKKLLNSIVELDDFKRETTI